MASTTHLSAPSATPSAAPSVAESNLNVPDDASTKKNPFISISTVSLTDGSTAEKAALPPMLGGSKRITIHIPLPDVKLPKINLPKITLPPALAVLGFPGRERIAGLKRKTFLWVLYGGILVLILALAIGLGVGLSQKKAREEEYKFSPLTSLTSAHTGDATYYAPGLGACGQTASEKDPVIAISAQLFDAARAVLPADAIGANGGLCGKRIRLYRVLRTGEGPGSWIYDEQVKGGLAGKNATVEGVVGDRCPGCSLWSLDLSPSLFRKVATESMGRVEIKWQLVESFEGLKVGN